MIANNSSGARSVLYGKTIDHVIEIKSVLSDGSLVHLRALTDTEVEARCAQQDLEGACYRATLELAAEHAHEIDRRFPKILRRVGGYNLDEFVPERVRKNGDLNLARLFVGSEGTLGLTVEAKLRLVELPRARATLVVEFAGLLEALAATPLILEHAPAAVEVVDKYVLDSTRLNPEASRLRDFLHGDPAAILLIEMYGDRPDLLTRRLGGLEAELRARGFGYSHLSVSGSGGTGPGLEAPHDGARAFDGRKRRRQGDLVRRGYCRRPGAPARLHRRVSENHRAPPDEGRRLRACLGRLPARAAGNQPQDRGRCAYVRGDCRGGL